MSTLPLFNHHLSVPVSGRSSTTRACSREAAIKVESKVERDRKLILDWIKVFGGLTDKELQQCLNMDGSSERPRRIELWKQGLIKEGGKREGCTIWVVVER